MDAKTAYESKPQQMDETALREINAFLNRTKKEAFWKLEEQEGMSNKEWAAAVPTTPTSLSNIILKFENFPYKLIEGRSSGRAKRYFLTELAKEYVFIIKKERENENDIPVFQQEEWVLGQRFGEYLEQLKRQREEEWESVIDNVLLNRLYGIGVDLEAEDERVVDALIAIIEKALEEDYDEAVNRCMKCLSPSGILQKRLEEYLRCFYSFSPFYKRLLQEENQIMVCRIFRIMIMNGKSEQCKAELQQLGLEENGVQLEKTIQWLKKICQGQTEEMIYKKLQQFMPGRGSMNVFLATWLCYSGEEKAQ